MILASHLGHESSVLALIERGADASVRDNAGKTAAIHAKEQSNDYILSELRKAAKAGPRKVCLAAGLRLRLEWESATRLGDGMPHCARACRTSSRRIQHHSR